MRLEKKPVNSDDFAALVELYGKAFAQPVSPRRWRWQYRENPWADPGQSLVYLDESGIAAHTASVPAPWWMDQRATTVSRLQNVFVRADLGRRGIFSRGLRELSSYLQKSDTSLLITFPVLSSQSYVPMMRSGLFHELTRLYPYKLVRSRAEELGRELVPGERLELDDRAVFCDEDRDLFEGRLNGFKLRCRRDSDYLSWRFSRRSGREYRVLRAWRGDRLRGLAVIKEYRPGSCVDLVEWVADDDKGLLRAMLRRCVETFPAATRIECWSARHYPLHSLLIELGFEREDRATAVLVHDCAGADAEADADTGADAGAEPSAYFLDPRAWYLSMADSDVY